MKTATAKFKCRLCGAMHGGATTGVNSSDDLICLTFETILGKPSQAMAPDMIEPHHCADGSVGISDFQGWQVEPQTS